MASSIRASFRGARGTLLSPVVTPTVMGSHVYRDDDDAPGTPFPVNVTINELDGDETVMVKSSATVTDLPLTPTGTTFEATEGTSFTVAVATFTDPNALAVATDFKA